MAKKFKEYYDTEYLKLISQKIKTVYPPFQSEKFIQHTNKELENKELFVRLDHIVNSFERYLTPSYEQNLKIFSQILGEKLKTSTGMFSEGWWLWPIGRYIERHCTQNPQASLLFIYELTQRFTGEFAIRPLLINNPKIVIQTCNKWSTDKSVHVRRLASEALRIRLPWAQKTNIVLNYIPEYITILTQLNSDPDKFVQKSVANNINDLFKEDPKLAKKIISDWNKNNPTKHTLWIIKHATRNQKS